METLLGSLGASGVEIEFLPVTHHFKLHCSSMGEYAELKLRQALVDRAIAHTANKHGLPLHTCRATLLFRNIVSDSWDNIMGSENLNALGISPVINGEPKSDRPPFDVSIFGVDEDALFNEDKPVYIQLQGADSPVLWANKAARGVQALKSLVGVSGLTLDFSEVISYLIRGLSTQNRKMSSFEFPGWRTVNKNYNGMDVIEQAPHLFVEDWYHGAINSVPVRVGQVRSAHPISHQEACDRLVKLR